MTDIPYCPWLCALWFSYFLQGNEASCPSSIPSTRTMHHAGDKAHRCCANITLTLFCVLLPPSNSWLTASLLHRALPQKPILQTKVGVIVPLPSFYPNPWIFFSSCARIQAGSRDFGHANFHTFISCTRHTPPIFVEYRELHPLLNSPQPSRARPTR